MGMISIDPNLQCQGHGRQLLSKVESFCVEKWGFGTRLVLHVIKQRTELIAWYVRRGYVEEKHEVPFPHDNPHVGLPLHDDLCFIQMTKTLQ